MSAKNVIVVFALFFLYFGYSYCDALASVPSNFPVIHTEVYGETADGKVFLTVSRNASSTGYYLMILNNDGSPYFYRDMDDCYPMDFKRLCNGYYTYAPYYGSASTAHKILNMDFDEVGEVSMGNGYFNNQHGIQLLPNGHYLLFCYDRIITDLTEYGGHPDATLITPVLQELDSDHKVVWQWRFLDYFAPDDGPWRLDQSTNEIIHLNSIELDLDGHILLSNMRMENCSKINRQTGEVMWILGGPLNQFTFVGCDPEEAVGWFDGHDFRRLANGNVLYFDNSDNYSNLPSHVVEFRLDEENLIAELVWDYVRDPPLRGSTRGNAQRLDNGNTMIGWGSASYYPGNPVCTEVNAAGETVFELSWTTPDPIASYRAFRFPVDYEPVSDVAVEDVVVGGGYDFIGDGAIDSGISVSIEDIIGEAHNALQIATYEWAPLNPTFAGHDPRVYKNRVVMSCEGIETISGKIYFDAGVFDISNPEDITICQRGIEGDGEFSFLSTVYAPVGGVVVADFAGDGEFIITYPDLEPIAFAPRAIEPEDGARVNDDYYVDIQWSPRGFITVFDLQIATDRAFLNVVADEAGLTSTSYRLLNVSAGADYYWRVRSYNDGGVSEWSQAASFTVTGSFIEVTSPDGSDVFSRGLEYFIAWQDNIYEEVVIELYKAGKFVKPIDTVESDGGYKWEIDYRLLAGCDYSIKITSSLDDGVFGMSDPFRIDKLRGDFDCDDCVGLDDLEILVDEWLDEGSDLAADANADGRVDVNDFAVLAGNWKKGCR